MRYLTSNHTAPPPRSTYGDGTISTQILIARDDVVTLAANDIYRHETAKGEAPLGYTDWALADGIYTREPAGTQAERDAHTKREQWAANAEQRKRNEAQQTIATPLDDDETQRRIDALNTLKG